MLPKKSRIDTKLIEKIFKTGTFVGSGALGLKYFLDNTNTPPRVSFVVPKKIEKRAVRRNYLKRRGYLILEKYFNEIPNGFFGVFIFNKTITTIEIENEIKKILNKIN
jgi:ribonuclease P protein component